ncbi:EamA family transporter [Psychroflexus halocasei]|uniref:Threonine/homoserine efflux transporter RhtA n=1 Tax=Psychroflexus halocasei TaxID=908615 RepID=A0A1H3VUL2_9FLAO|nr:DMT family transporter [Psychroflexus halocasei]SDZ78430.1 Threonine/homoserine efflux transporter RhtA [Psychroflexus halocasei]
MNSVLKGALFVALGSSCYGMLTTFVKLAYKEDFTVYEVTFAQLFIGFIGLIFLNFFLKKSNRPEETKAVRNRSRLYLMLSGTSLGFTSIFYYLAMETITVSVGIVLLMQSVWIGVMFDIIVNKVKPTKQKIFSVILVLVGTVLAADILTKDQSASGIGLFYGFCAAISFAATIITSSRVSLQYHSITRSKWMILGGLIVATIFTAFTFGGEFDFGILKLWGPILALFGTILPPLFLTSGMPKINVGLGAIISSIELPVAVMMGYFVLGEQQNYIKWIGILMILSAIILMNYKKAVR